MRSAPTSATYRRYYAPQHTGRGGGLFG